MQQTSQLLIAYKMDESVSAGLYGPFWSGASQPTLDVSFDVDCSNLKGCLAKRLKSNSKFSLFVGMFVCQRTVMPMWGFSHELPPMLLHRISRAGYCQGGLIRIRKSVANDTAGDA